jgi:hypothetical protein
MSVDASGTYARTLTFSKWKGRNYVRERVIPANPKSAKQMGVRAMLKFLAQAWAAIGASPQASWAADAAAKSISPFNEYCSANLSRWQGVDGPTKTNPAAETSAPLTITTQTLTGGVGQVTVDVTPSAATDIWAIAIFRDTAAITTPNWTNCIAVVLANGASLVSYVDSPLVAGTYHYRTAAMNIDGIIGTVKADGTATAT